MTRRSTRKDSFVGCPTRIKDDLIGILDLLIMRFVAKESRIRVNGGLPMVYASSNLETRILEAKAESTETAIKIERLPSHGLLPPEPNGLKVALGEVDVRGSSLQSSEGIFGA